jgi:hypothetical protein
MTKLSLPDMTHSFDIQTKGKDTDINWTGAFKYKRPTIGDRGRISVLRTRLNGDLETIDDETSLLNEALSHLRYTLIEFPDWWTDTHYGMDLYDVNIVTEIFSECMKFEAKWNKKLNEVSDASGDAEAIESDS